MNLEGWMKVPHLTTGWISLNCLNNSSCGTSTYAPHLSTTTHAFSNYAWEPDVMGWISFANAASNYTPPVANTNQCLSTTVSRHINNDLTYTDTTCTFAAQGYPCDYPSGLCLWPPAPSSDLTGQPTGLQLKPSIVRVNNPIKVIWDIKNASSTTCAVTGSNGDSWTGSATNAPAGVTSKPITQRTTYTLTCHGAIDNSQVYTTTAIVNILPEFRER
jgi:hypothetical protein